MKSSMKIKRQVEEMKLIKGNSPRMFNSFIYLKDVICVELFFTANSKYNFLNELPSILGLVELDSWKQLSLRD